MAKIYFYYGVMGSSKTANALMTKFGFEEKGMTVWLIKPSTDTRDGVDIIRSRIGLEATATVIRPEDDILSLYGGQNIVICDECQFLTVAQVDRLRTLADNGIPVYCYGLRTDFQTHLFEGSKRLFEIADTFHEIKTHCECGAKATINARVQGGKIVTEGEVVALGGNESYVSMCHRCYDRHISKKK